MIKEKERLLREYFEATRTAIELLEFDNFEDLLKILELRDSLIQKINTIDEGFGMKLITPSIQKIISDLLEIDQFLIQKLQEKKDAVLGKMHSIQVGKLLRDQYNPQYQYTDGIFYDKKK